MTSGRSFVDLADFAFPVARNDKELSGQLNRLTGAYLGLTLPRGPGREVVGRIDALGSGQRVGVWNIHRTPVLGSGLSRSERRARMSLGQPWLRNLQICSGKSREMINGLRSLGSEGKHHSWQVEIPETIGVLSFSEWLQVVAGRQGVSADALEPQ